MMEYITVSCLTEHPWLTGGIVLLILLLPYDVRTITRSGYTCRVWRAATWQWEQRRGSWHLQLHGLHHIQEILLGLIGWLWHQSRGEILKRLLEYFRDWLGSGGAYK